ncbi:DNA-directed RNA polymerase III subunit RPC4 [Spatholobus suberectus]|nr:DNA-directed RNA polymerase III subunit RPC4 [Spatholobus suberectus]
MDSESPKDAPGVRRKVKFAPRAPPRRVPKLEVVKTEVVEDADADQAKDLLRRFNESAMKAKHKVEKKVSASQIAFGYGGESTSIKSYGIPRGGSSANISQNSAFSGVREKEYKEPWDYYSNYPVTLPLRRPYSGNPELLDEEEFGEAAESRTYDESASNPAMELGLLEENLEASMFLINLPPTLPMIKQLDTAGGQDVNVKSKPPGGSKDVEKPCKLNEIPSGFMGKMVVYRNGAIKLKLGNTLYDVSSGMNCVFAQDVVSINTAQKHCCTIGEISKHVTITPDVDAIVDNLSDW